jgi:hypothetical protein
MANDAMKLQIANNRRICRFWFIISIVVTSISAFWIFYLKRNTPKDQNIKTFVSGLICAVIGFFIVLRKIRVHGAGRNVFTEGNLSGSTKKLLDIIGVGLLVEFFGIWWYQAAFLFLLIPVFIIYDLLKGVCRWLEAF